METLTISKILWKAYMDIVSGDTKWQIGKVCEELHNVSVFGLAVWGCPLRANSEFCLRSHHGPGAILVSKEIIIAFSVFLKVSQLLLLIDKSWIYTSLRYNVMLFLNQFLFIISLLCIWMQHGCVMCASVCVCTYINNSVHIWKSKDNFGESIFFPPSGIQNLKLGHQGLWENAFTHRAISASLTQQYEFLK